MSDVVKSQVEVDDLVERCAVLRSDIKQRLADVKGAGDDTPFGRLWEELSACSWSVERAMAIRNGHPQPDIGDEIEVEDPFQIVGTAEVLDAVVVAINDNLS